MHHATPVAPSRGWLLTLLLLALVGCDSGGDDGSGSLRAPVLHTPLNEGTSRERTVVFDWQPVSGAEYYEIDVQPSDPSFDEGTTFTIEADAAEVTFERAAEYGWRVRPISSEEEGPWSELRTLTVGQPFLTPERQITFGVFNVNGSDIREGEPIVIGGTSFAPRTYDASVGTMASRGTVERFAFGDGEIQLVQPIAASFDFAGSAAIEVRAEGMEPVTVATGQYQSGRSVALQVDPEADTRSCLTRTDCRFHLVLVPSGDGVEGMAYRIESSSQFQAEGLMPTW